MENNYGQWLKRGQRPSVTEVAAENMFFAKC